MTSTTDATRRLRRRLTSVAVLVVALVLLAVAVALLVLQRRQLLTALDDRLARRADAATSGLEGGATVLPQADPEDGFAQVVTAEGSVLAATANIASAGPVVPAPGDRERVRTADVGAMGGDRFRVLSRPVSVEGQPVVLHVGEDVDDIDDATGTLGLSLAVAGVVVVVSWGGLTWWLVGRTLRPVEAAAARQARFVSDASHELRSPLARIRARLEVDLAHPEGSHLAATASAVLDDARSMQHLVDDLLVLATTDEASTDGQARAHAPVDLDDIVLAEVPGSGQGQHVDVDTSRVSGALVLGDHDDLARVVRNLVENAERHARSLVRVTLTEAGGWAVLEVDDDGPGVPPERRADVFERFARLDDARTPGSGSTGLGLAIARELAERHGGRVTVGDAPIGGARFTLWLPSA